MMSWTRIWIHVVFTTKYRTHFLDDRIRRKVFLHIKKSTAEKGIHVDVVNGYTDHAHCLLLLDRDQVLSKVVQQIKGESAYWINKNGLTTRKFVWQDDYWAVSVSERHVPKVRNYILKQEEHHNKMTFSDEISRFEAKYKFKRSS
jgi:putative transposase